MLSRIIRRTHMYLALFLAPWVLMYALSTIVMNHREHLGQGAPRFHVESERAYHGEVPPGIAPRQAAMQILRDLEMEGAYNATRNPAGMLVVQRFHPVSPKRITYDPAHQKVVIEAMEFRMPAFLERMHRRRGFQHPFVRENTWAFSVDLFIFAMIFWVASGLWMWWEMKVTRVLGALFALGGVALCALFLLSI